MASSSEAVLQHY